MGLVQSLFAMLFGNGQNIVKETAEVFRENAEAASKRRHALQSDALAQFGAEFTNPTRGLFDRFMDALNRLPRPAMALGTIALFVAAMVDPIWFASRMQGIQLVPEPLWWLLGAIVSFYFGARYQSKSQDFQRSIATTLGKTGVVMSNINALSNIATKPQTGIEDAENPALKDWQNDARR